MAESPSEIARDVAAVGRISAIPLVLRIICQHTGMGFAAVARVSDDSWTACAVEDRIAFGLQPGGQLDLHTTLCKESRQARQPIVIDHASMDARYCGHHTPRLYRIESYVSVPIVRPDGEYFGNLCAIDPAPAQVKNARTLAMFESFAELIGQQLAIEQSRDEAQSALLDARATAELREQFVTVLGHDLRNPLASVGAIGDVLLRRPDREIAEFGQRLRTTTRRMSQLIDDVLDLARVRMGLGMSVQLRPVDDLAARLAQVVAELRDAHPGRRIETRLDIGAPVACDPGRLQQVLSNLAGNALRHGAAGGVVTVEGRRDDAGALTLAVHNVGEPIAPQDLPRIFEPYWRSARSADGGGLGLGLHISAQIVRAHGGTLQVSSTREHGTRFIARLPAAAPAAEATLPA